jgi:hypothetical protein
MTCSEIIDIRTEMMAINDIEKTNASNQTLRDGELNPHQQHYDQSTPDDDSAPDFWGQNRGEVADH